MVEEDEETRKAVEAVDKMEDEAADAREKEESEGKQKDEEDFIICPKCRSIVDEADFVEDELSEIGATSITYRINCSRCGYSGVPVEMSSEDYLKMVKENKPK